MKNIRNIIEEITIHTRSFVLPEELKNLSIKKRLNYLVGNFIVFEKKVFKVDSPLITVEYYNDAMMWLAIGEII
jgi:hypothetical protein